METLVLVFERPELTFNDLGSLIAEKSWLSDNSKCLIVGDSDDRHLFVVRVVDPDSDGIFEAWPKDVLPLGATAIFAVDYRSCEFVVRVVQEIAAAIDMLVDTNYGEIVRGSQLSVEHLIAR